MRQLFIDSRDRIPGGTSTNFQIQLREQLVVSAGNSFRIDNLRIPLVIPLIQGGYNDKLYFTLGGVVKTATLAQGNYSGSELATLVQAAMAGQGATFTVTYDYHTASMSIVCSDATFRVLTDAEATAAGKALPTFATALQQNPYTYTAVGGATLRFSYVSIQAEDMFYLTSQKLSNQDTFGPNGSTDAITCAVPNGDFASVLLQSMPTSVFLTCPTMTTSLLDFQLRDRDYNVLSSLLNISFVLTIQ